MQASAAMEDEDHLFLPPFGVDEDALSNVADRYEADAALAQILQDGIDADAAEMSGEGAAMDPEGWPHLLSQLYSHQDSLLEQDAYASLEEYALCMGTGVPASLFEDLDIFTWADVDVPAATEDSLGLQLSPAEFAEQPAALAQEEERGPTAADSIAESSRTSRVRRSGAGKARAVSVNWTGRWKSALPARFANLDTQKVNKMSVGDKLRLALQCKRAPAFLVEKTRYEGFEIVIALPDDDRTPLPFIDPERRMVVNLRGTSAVIGAWFRSPPNIDEFNHPVEIDASWTLRDGAKVDVEAEIRAMEAICPNAMSRMRGFKRSKELTNFNLLEFYTAIRSDTQYMLLREYVPSLTQSQLTADPMANAPSLTLAQWVAKMQAAADLTPFLATTPAATMVPLLHAIHNVANVVADVARGLGYMALNGMQYNRSDVVLFIDPADATGLKVQRCALENFAGVTASSAPARDVDFYLTTVLPLAQLQMTEVGHQKSPDWYTEIVLGRPDEPAGALSTLRLSKAAQIPVPRGDARPFRHYKKNIGKLSQALQDLMSIMRLDTHEGRAAFFRQHVEGLGKVSGSLVLSIAQSVKAMGAMMDG